MWGLFGVPERDLGVLGDVRGLDVAEVGCGTAYRGSRGDGTGFVGCCTGRAREQDAPSAR